MKHIPDKSVDLVLTDPPYNAKNIGPNQRIYEGSIMQLPLKDYKKFCNQWFQEAYRISGGSIVMTPGISNVCFYPQPFWILCWHKPTAVSFNRMGGYNAWEPIMCYRGPTKGQRLGQDYIKVNTLNLTKGAEKNHPCPKVLGLIRYLIEKFSGPTDTILDPFLGSGTTAVACKELGRNFIGIEIEPKYCEIAERRLANTITEMFCKTKELE